MDGGYEMVRVTESLDGLKKFRAKRVEVRKEVHLLKIRVIQNVCPSSLWYILNFYYNNSWSHR